MAFYEPNHVKNIFSGFVNDESCKDVVFMVGEEQLSYHSQVLRNMFPLIRNLLPNHGTCPCAVFVPNYYHITITLDSVTPQTVTTLMSTVYNPGKLTYLSSEEMRRIKELLTMFGVDMSKFSFKQARSIAVLDCTVSGNNIATTVASNDETNISKEEELLNEETSQSEQKNSKTSETVEEMMIDKIPHIVGSISSPMPHDDSMSEELDEESVDDEEVTFSIDSSAEETIVVGGEEGNVLECSLGLTTASDSSLKDVLLDERVSDNTTARVEQQESNDEKDTPTYPQVCLPLEDVNKEENRVKELLVRDKFDQGSDISKCDVPNVSLDAYVDPNVGDVTTSPEALKGTMCHKFNVVIPSSKDQVVAIEIDVKMNKDKLENGTIPQFVEANKLGCEIASNSEQITTLVSTDTESKNQPTDTKTMASASEEYQNVQVGGTTAIARENGSEYSGVDNMIHLEAIGSAESLKSVEGSASSDDEDIIEDEEDYVDEEHYLEEENILEETDDADVISSSKTIEESLQKEETFDDSRKRKNDEVNENDSKKERLDLSLSPVLPSSVGTEEARDDGDDSEESIDLDSMSAPPEDVRRVKRDLSSSFEIENNEKESIVNLDVFATEEKERIVLVKIDHGEASILDIPQMKKQKTRSSHKSDNYEADNIGRFESNRLSDGERGSPKTYSVKFTAHDELSEESEVFPESDNQIDIVGTENERSKIPSIETGNVVALFHEERGKDKVGCIETVTNSNGSQEVPADVDVEAGLKDEIEDQDTSNCEESNSEDHFNNHEPQYQPQNIEAGGGIGEVYDTSKGNLQKDNPADDSLSDASTVISDGDPDDDLEEQLGDVVIADGEIETTSKDDTLGNMEDQKDDAKNVNADSPINQHIELVNKTHEDKSVKDVLSGEEDNDSVTDNPEEKLDSESQEKALDIKTQSCDEDESDLLTMDDDDVDMLNEQTEQSLIDGEYDRSEESKEVENKSVNPSEMEVAPISSGKRMCSDKAILNSQENVDNIEFKAPEEETMVQESSEVYMRVTDKEKQQEAIYQNPMSVNNDGDTSIFDFSEKENIDVDTSEEKDLAASKPLATDKVVIDPSNLCCIICPDQPVFKRGQLLVHLTEKHYSKKLLDKYPFTEGTCQLCVEANRSRATVCKSKAAYAKHVGTVHEKVLELVPSQLKEAVHAFGRRRTSVSFKNADNDSVELVKNIVTEPESITEVTEDAYNYGTEDDEDSNATREPRMQVPETSEHKGTEIKAILSGKCPFCPNIKTQFQRPSLLNHLSSTHYNKQLLDAFPYMEGETCKLCVETGRQPPLVVKSKTRYITHMGSLHEKVIELLPHEIRDAMEGSKKVPLRTSRRSVIRKEMMENTSPVVASQPLSNCGPSQPAPSGSNRAPAPGPPMKTVPGPPVKTLPRTTTISAVSKEEN